MAGPTIEVAAPDRSPRVGGLSSIATFRPNDRLGAADGLVFQSDGCEFPRSEVSRCIAAAAPADKTFSGISTNAGVGEPFTLYAGVNCYIGPDSDFIERARRTLSEGQDRPLEAALETWAAGGDALANGGSVAEAVALVEQGLDSGYVGRGVILMSRADVIRADAEGVVHKVGDQIQTITGTPVIASGMVTPGTVYGLGAIVVEYSQVVDYQVDDPQSNQRYALAEGSFAILVDCEFRIKSATTA